MAKNQIPPFTFDIDVTKYTDIDDMCKAVDAELRRQYAEMFTPLTEFEKRLALTIGYDGGDLKKPAYRNDVREEAKELLKALDLPRWTPLVEKSRTVRSAGPDEDTPQLINIEYEYPPASYVLNKDCTHYILLSDLEKLPKEDA